MKKNVGTIDSATRMVIATIVTLMYFADVLNPYIALVIVAVLVLTAFLNFCPLYKLFGASTHRLDKEK
ncbi:MAG: DUF2892 domain-containing protein [Flavobacterium sp.]|nr:MAG: DUF2892 domain-containing protein [Flavobacterium sp.]